MGKTISEATASPNSFTKRIVFRFLLTAAALINLYEVQFVQSMRFKFEGAFLTIITIASSLTGLILVAIARRRREWLSEPERKLGMALGIVCEIPLVIIGVAAFLAENSPTPA